MAFRDRRRSDKESNLGGRGLLTGALGGGGIGGTLSGIGDALQGGFAGIGSGGIFGGRQRARRRADAAAQEADLAQASDPALQVDTVDTIDSTGLGTVGMNEIAMEDPMLSASVNNRQFTPYSKKGKVKVKQRSYGEEGEKLPIVKSGGKFYLSGGDYHDPESDTPFSGEFTSEIKGPSKRAIKGKGRRSGESYVDIVGGGGFDFAAMENIKPI